MWAFDPTLCCRTGAEEPEFGEYAEKVLAMQRRQRVGRDADEE